MRASQSLIKRIAQSAVGSGFRGVGKFSTGSISYSKADQTGNAARDQAGPGISESTTHFGFTTVQENMKEKLVAKVFSGVASKYDLMNDAMSAGIHRLWKDYFIRKMAPQPGTKLIDVAGGTGDIAYRFLNYTSNICNDNTSTVHLVDINADMLGEGQKRFENTHWMKNNQIKFNVGNGEDLNFIEDNTYDAYTISFGIRNCTHVDRVVKEAYRVLKPGGVFMCLEFSKVNYPVLSE
ncbi:2-methoxy-6-polyprenyl-1,4-benzoquinol methylase, mitochondrial [Zancudomyces culisetae]|uniref:2-methoxy-6-polyprenyl-1,4-benzoquinol methylase, mitochondrial n=1 Tax=Zancudomyces culisetae TaxID=1213189 RepID=A0A1R1PR58_ZANCU|nr:2-methoxy-6-polyprenyl-1,4-benzoquinol methylase, mitochondrial [Zancudomyces culisetae]|eukprot:OMH83460.1 2-methoxy-6-polyprenyl-1,4-benzoquinol methylase, mitochondrial [Zancudomyces culisetae]